MIEVRTGTLNGKEAIAVLTRSISLVEPTWQATVYVRDHRSHRNIGEAHRQMDTRPDSERLLGVLERVEGEAKHVPSFDIVDEAKTRGWFTEKNKAA
jgi:hypothetical protein